MISIHAPLTGSDDQENGPDIISSISIHAPLTGSDLPAAARARLAGISIHAPLTGSDLRYVALVLSLQDFNPRSPYGERPGINVDFNGNRLFQSTLPLRGATPRWVQRF